jgi:hypothetical protein
MSASLVLMVANSIAIYLSNEEYDYLSLPYVLWTDIVEI